MSAPSAVNEGQAELATAQDSFTAAFFRGIQPDPVHLTVSQWADEYRLLSSRASSEPGRWNTSRTPYLREPMDALSPQDPTKQVTMLFGSQLGKTETGLNWIGSIIDLAPGPMLMVQPNTDMVKKVVKQRLDPAINETPNLRAKVAEQKSREGGNSQWAKEFEGGILIMAGANAPAGLASMPIRYLFMDEVDRYPGDVDGEGDPVNLAKARTRTFGNSKILITSTPTESGNSRIETSFEDSDQRHYYIPCPDCEEKQVLKFGNLVWDKEVDKVTGKEKDLPETVAYMCQHCGSLIPEHKKTWILEHGDWIAHAPHIKHHKGYFLNSLYSPLGWYSWADIVTDFLKAKGRPSELKVFVNTVLAETWREKGDVPDWEALYRRRDDYAFNTCPRGILFLTAGVDIQRDRIEIEVVGWGRRFRSWSVDYRVLKGDTSDAEVWAKLWGCLSETWPIEGSATRLKIEMLAVDSSDQTQIVYKQVRDVSDPRVMAIKGMDNMVVPVGPPKDVDIDIHGKKIYRGTKLWPVGSSVIKTELYGFFRQPPPLDEGHPEPDGFCHWPQYEKEHFQQLTAEQRVRRTINGKTAFRWEKKYERNEALDCRVYARAAAYVYGLDRFVEEHYAQLETRLEELPKIQHNKPEAKKTVNPFTGKEGPFI